MSGPAADDASRGHGTAHEAALDSNLLPRHLAITADGNGRWATARGLPRSEGHREGGETFLRLLEDIADYGIEYLTFYAMSTENLARPAEEVEYLFDLYAELLPRLATICQQRGIKMRHLGRQDVLTTRVREPLRHAEMVTSGGKSTQLQMCMGYGGRQEITDAVRRMVAAGAAGRLSAEQVNTDAFNEYLYAPDLPDVDLLIRTSGEQRLSNFVTWQAVYAELIFTPVLWPDFTAEDLRAELTTFAGRRRRFGRAVDQ